MGIVVGAVSFVGIVVVVIYFVVVPRMRKKQGIDDKGKKSDRGNGSAGTDKAPAKAIARPGVSDVRERRSAASSPYADSENQRDDSQTPLLGNVFGKPTRMKEDLNDESQGGDESDDDKRSESSAQLASMFRTAWLSVSRDAAAAKRRGNSSSSSSRNIP